MSKEENTTETTEFQKINTTSRTTINNTLAIGQCVRNGGGRMFEITALDESQITLKALNPDKKKEGQTLTMGRKVFVDLYYLKNYDQLRSISNARREIIDAKATGADRFLL